LDAAVPEAALTGRDERRVEVRALDPLGVRPCERVAGAALLHEQGLAVDQVGLTTAAAAAHRDEAGDDRNRQQQDTDPVPRGSQGPEPYPSGRRSPGTGVGSSSS